MGDIDISQSELDKWSSIQLQAVSEIMDSKELLEIANGGSRCRESISIKLKDRIIFQDDNELKNIYSSVLFLYGNDYNIVSFNITPNITYNTPTVIGTVYIELREK